MTRCERRVAVHRLVDGMNIVEYAVIVIRNGRVVDYYPFIAEQPFTEWLGGTAVIKKNDDGTLVAYLDGEQIK